MSRVILVCPACGSDEIVRDASAVWNVEMQLWEMSDPLGQTMWCNACGDDFERAEERPA